VSLVELSALIGAFLPTLVAIVNQPRWPSWARAAATVLLCIAVGAVTAAASGELTGKRWFESAGIVFAAALATYHAWWRPSGITTAIERATAVSAR